MRCKHHDGRGGGYLELRIDLSGIDCVECGFAVDFNRYAELEAQLKQERETNDTLRKAIEGKDAEVQEMANSLLKERAAREEAEKDRNEWRDTWRLNAQHLQEATPEMDGKFGSGPIPRIRSLVERAEQALALLRELEESADYCEVCLFALNEETGDKHRDDCKLAAMLGEGV